MMKCIYCEQLLPDDYTDEMVATLRDCTSSVGHNFLDEDILRMEEEGVTSYLKDPPIAKCPACGNIPYIQVYTLMLTVGELPYIKCLECGKVWRQEIPRKQMTVLESQDRVVDVVKCCGNCENWCTKSCPALSKGFRVLRWGDGYTCGDFYLRGLNNVS